MGMSDLLLGRRIVLRSSLSPDEVALRINGATGSVLNPLQSGVSGWAYAGLVSLHWAVPMLNGPQKHLLGRLVTDGAGTEIRSRFGMHPLHKLFLLLWFGFIVLIGSALVSALIEQGTQTGYEGLGLMMLGLFALIPLVFLFLFNRDAERELEAILDLLCDVAHMTVVNDPWY